MSGETDLTIALGNVAVNRLPAYQLVCNSDIEYVKNRPLYVPL